MDFKIGDRVIYINDIYLKEVGTITETLKPDGFSVKVKFDSNHIGDISIYYKNLRKLTKLEKALA